MLTLSYLTPDPETFGKRRGMMIILSSPSGAGKSSTSRMILAADKDIDLSVSATTRNIRPGEEDGVHYHFVSHDTFESMIADNAFFEHAKVFDNYYGTPKKPVFDALEQGKDVMFDIDWQGAQQMRHEAREDIVSIFLLPPSVADLKTRLMARNQDDEATVAKRMQGAEGEISHWAEYDYVLINRDLDETVRAVQSIIAAERLKRRRQPGTSKFAAQLLHEAQELKA